jgi:phosphate transport system permease protein
MASQQPPIRIEDLRVDPRRARTQTILRRLFFASAALAILITIGIIWALLADSVYFITHVTLDQLLDGTWLPRSNRYDIPTLIIGTLVISLIGMLIAVPLGLGAAIYLAEYASPRLRGILKPILEILAAIPSVVLGFFALTVLSPNLITPICEVAHGFAPSIFNMASAGVAVGVLITPLVASVSEDAMYAVPSSLREASYGLGARKRTTTLRVVFPAAVSGIVAAMIIGLSRAIGETMIVSIAAGGVGGGSRNWDPCLPGQTMTAAMVSLAIGSDQTTTGPQYSSLFFVGMLLFLMTLGLNLVSESYVRRMRGKGAI